MAKPQRLIICCIAILATIAQVTTAASQVPADLQLNSEQLISKVTFALQTGDKAVLNQWLEFDLLNAILGATDGKGLDTRLRDLGPIIGTDVSGWETTEIGKSFSARVTHESGMVSWSIAIDPVTQRVQSIDFQIFPSKPRPASRSNHGLNLRSGPPKQPHASNLSIDEAPAVVCGRDPSSCNSLTAPALLGTKQWAFDPRVVDFLFATTRKRGPGDNVTFTGERGTHLTYGAASVRVPDDHKIGRIEFQSAWKLWGIAFRESASNERKNFTVRKVAALSPDQWRDAIRARATKRALIFVHGFNTTFEDSVYRNAQIIWDLQYPGLSVLFSWASAGHVSDYFYDQGSASLARSAFIMLLKTLKETYGIEKVDVLAHSMGNLIVLDALSSYAKTSNPVHIGELVMAAPDVDADGFIAMVPDVQRVVKGMTLYASSTDKALAASRIPARVPRAGDVPAGGPIVVKDVETIDVTAVGDEIFGLHHSEFATNRAIMDDIKLIISTGMRPPSSRLSQIRAFPELPSEPRYWRYTP